MKVWSLKASWHTDGVQCQALQNVLTQSCFLAAMGYIKNPKQWNPKNLHNNTPLPQQKPNQTPKHHQMQMFLISLTFGKMDKLEGNFSP